MHRLPARRAWALAALAVLAPFLAGCTEPLVRGPAVEVPAGRVTLVPFQLEEPGRVYYSVESRDETPFDACLVPADGAAAPLSCHRNVRQAAESLDLAAGRWAIALQCGANGGSCRVLAHAFEA